MHFENQGMMYIDPFEVQLFEGNNDQSQHFRGTLFADKANPSENRPFRSKCSCLDPRKLGELWHGKLANYIVT